MLNAIFPHLRANSTIGGNMKSHLRIRSIGLALAALLIVTSAVAAGSPGFFTAQPSMLTPLAPGSSALPIISVGDTLPGGYRFEAIPDGIGVALNGQGTVDVFVSHETSLVPFPYTVTGATATGQSDFDNAQVSKLRLHQKSAGVLKGWIAIDGSANYQRFCSAFLADKEHGFQHPVFFANEEATDFISPPPLLAWPPDPANQRQAGLVVALDTKTGRTYEIPGLGRMNHENTVVVPGGWDEVVVLTDDDTFSAPAAQLYMYLANTPGDLLADKGGLYAFVSDNAAINDYGDLPPGMSVSGHFVPVPREIALGDQTPLEIWSNANNVFQFIRTEDMAYDKNNPHIVYIADTGEPRAIADPATGRLQRGSSSTRGPYPNGRIFKMVLNANDPTVVDSLSILIDADAGGYNNPAVLHNPDNLDTSANSLMIQEDPGSHNQSNPGAGPAARIWRYDLETGALSVVAEVDQSSDPAARLGVWESSGIVDASAVFGPGTWLVTIQAHSLFVETETRTVIDTSRTPPVTATLLFKREGGQLLLFTVPGS
jgi:hypothetical protein